MRSTSKAVSYNSCYDSMKRLFTAHNLLTAKMLHQGRGEAQREMEDALVPSNQIDRLARYLQTDKELSYRLNVPLQAALQRAGYDHLDPSSWKIKPAHLSVPVLEMLIDALMPQMKKEAKEVEDALAVTKNFTQAKKDDLLSFKGLIDTLKHMEGVWIACSAARPRDADMNIDLNSPTLRLDGIRSNPPLS